MQQQRSDPVRCFDDINDHVFSQRIIAAGARADGGTIIDTLGTVGTCTLLQSTQLSYPASNRCMIPSRV